ncbi:alpha/beta fold hydrolase [Pseudonocardia lutea]|uniref:Alpha/beta fold hydrolase n=1 Tax=Pseudonocardia lutea TaxID=2172015 RepID=A0ABW1IBJ5_9PSEU
MSEPRVMPARGRLRSAASASGPETGGPRHVEVLGRRVRVDVRPGPDGGRPLLMLMGLGGNIEMWEPFRRLLAERTGRTTVAYDVPGTGESPAPLLPWPLPLHGALAARLMTQLGLSEFDVMGLSWGGLLVQQVALTVPNRVGRVVLANTNFGIGSVPGRPSVIRVLATLDRYRSAAALADAASAFGGGAAPDTMSEHSAARLARPPSWRGYYYQMLALSGWSSLATLPLLRRPVLLLTGDDDPAIPVINARVMSALLPDSRLHVVAGAGHLLLFDRPAEAADVVAGFLGAEKG